MKFDGQDNQYMLLDSRDEPLAHGLLLSAPDEDELQVQVLGGRVGNVVNHEMLQLVGLADNAGSILGRVVRQNGDIVVLERLQALADSVRQNLRMPVQFDTFLYPVSGKWKGRMRAEAHDLSCGGIAFFCHGDLQDGECVEIVIPVTTEPLLLRCKILRRRLSARDEPLYAAKFIDLCHDEEIMVREAVFGIQLSRYASNRTTTR